MYVFEFETEVRFLSWRKLFYKSYTHRFFALAAEEESQELMIKLCNLRSALTHRNVKTKITLVNRVSIGSIDTSLVECTGTYVTSTSIPCSNKLIKDALKYKTPMFIKVFRLIVGDRYWKTLAKVGDEFFNHF